MKKLFFGASFVLATTFVFSCNENAKTENTHTHDDGSTHSDHDTIKPAQQEFNVPDTLKKDTVPHTHADGEQHSH